MRLIVQIVADKIFDRTQMTLIVQMIADKNYSICFMGLRLNRIRMTLIVLIIADKKSVLNPFNPYHQCSIKNQRYIITSLNPIPCSVSIFTASSTENILRSLDIKTSRLLP